MPESVENKILLRSARALLKVVGAKALTYVLSFFKKKDAVNS